MITTLFLVLALPFLFQIKHFLADYPLQTPYMLGKFKSGKDWILPLTAHCAVHFLFTVAICLIFEPAEKALLLGLFDFTTHFIMDRIKASPKLLGRYKALSATEILQVFSKTASECPVERAKAQDSLRSNRLFWWALGFDQMVHHMTHYVIMFLIIAT